MKFLDHFLFVIIAQFNKSYKSNDVMKAIKFCRLCIILIIGIYSCDTPKTETIVVDPLNLNMQLEDFFDTCRVMILDSSRLAMISNPGKIIKKDSLYYIQDISRKTISVFDTTGRCVSQINRLGRSSTEYVDLTNFDVYNGFVYILSRVNKKIYKYDIYGEFFDRCELDDWYGEFIMVNDDTVLLFSDYANNKMYNYILYDWDNEKSLSECDEFSVNGNLTFMGIYLAKFGDEILSTKPFDYNIYRYCQNSITPIVNLEFKTHDKIIYDEDMSVNSERAEGKSVVKNFEGFTKVCDDRYYLLYNMIIPNTMFGTRFLSSVNITDSTSNTTCLGFATKEYPLGFSNSVLCGDVLVALVSPIAYKNIVPTSTISENSNYVLVEYKLK